MGRTSKFSFPVPSRRNRKSQMPPPPVIESSTPIFPSKIEQILGSGQQPTPKQRRTSVASSLHWETGSTSAISVAISDTSQTTATPTSYGLSVLPEDAEHYDWDQDSVAATPSYTNYRNRHLSVAPSVASIGSVDAASVLRRSQSNSTITSFYDKSRVPLSISQQTSSSAMAKGLPNKASAVMNMDASPVAPQKKKPSKLNLASYVRSKRSQQSLHSDAATHSEADVPPVPPLSPTAIVPTQSAVSGGEPSPNSTRQRFHRKFLDVTRQPGSRRLRSTPSDHSLKSQQTTTTELNSLYDHYERMSFRQVPERDESSPDVTEQEGGLKPLTILEEEDTINDDHFIPMRSATLPPRIYDSNHLSPPESPQNAQNIYQEPVESSPEYFDSFNPIMAMAPQMPAASDDCSASLSSRVTKGSKTSKGSTKKSSLIEADLLERSMLSLSSDSEDDNSIFSASKPSAPKRASICTSLSSDISSYGADERSLMLSRTPSRKSSTRKSHLGPANHYLAIPHDQPIPRVKRQSIPCPSSISSSPRSPSSAQSAHPPVPPVTPEMAAAAVATAPVRSNSTTGTLLPARTLPEAPPGDAPTRALPAIPVGRSASGRAKSVDQATPPLSPEGANFLVRTASQSSVASSRVMTVTRQEELLLAALRQKRARMRENIISELEEEGIHQPRSCPSQATITDHKASRRRLSTGSRASAGTAGHASMRKAPYGRSTPVAAASQPGSLNPSPELFAHSSSSPRSKPSPPASLKQEPPMMLFLDPTTDEAADASDLGDYADDSDDDISSDDFFRLPEPPRHTYTRQMGAGGPAAAAAGAGAATPLKAPLLDVDVCVAASSHGSDSDLVLVGIPRPDSPPTGDAADVGCMARRKAARLSAVGMGNGIPFWGDDD
ncbi:hypothetical protein BROUX41_001147 [Berkeleyomyces rouxiae]|uniref:uncharacterized protein n=1 Tax=Berkeleyomyces rouxiae TaxID=2035830 RepID=UPI003B7B11B2